MTTALLLTRYADEERNFQLADLHGFDLTGADLTDTVLAGAVLRETSLAGWAGPFFGEARRTA